MNLYGCSYIADFIISNNSSENISISYSSKSLNCKAETGYFSNPVVKPSLDITKNKEEWVKADFDCIPLTNTMYVNLAPNQAVRVFRVNNYFEEDRDKYNEYYSDVVLKIEGADGNIELSGYKVLSAFKNIKVS